MKNIRFCAAVVVLMTVMTLVGYSLLRAATGTLYLSSAWGKLQLFSSGINARSNADRITDISAETFERTSVPLPDGTGGLTADRLDHIVIDGHELAFPIRVGDLPEEFSYILYSNGPIWDDNNDIIPNAYSGSMTLVYKGQFIGQAVFRETHLGVDEETLLIKLLISKSESAYFPQILIADMDMNELNEETLHMAYGLGGENWRLYDVTLNTEKGCYSLRAWDSHLFNPERESRTQYIELQYYDSPQEAKASVILMEDNYTVPEDYSIETDAINNAMEFTPLFEKNEAWTKIVKNLAIVGNNAVPMPCTLNALMTKLGDDARIAALGSAVYYPERNAVSCELAIYFTDKDGQEKVQEVTVLLPIGGNLGDAQVIEMFFKLYDNDQQLAFDIEYARELLKDLQKDRNTYEFRTTKEEDTTQYALTDDPHNNIVFSYESERSFRNGTLTVSYWPDAPKP